MLFEAMIDCPTFSLAPTHLQTVLPEQKAKAVAQPDELIDFHHLKMRKGLSKVELEDRCGRWWCGHGQRQGRQRLSSLGWYQRRTVHACNSWRTSGLTIYNPLPHSSLPGSVASDLARATGLADAAAAASNRLNKIVQLTGFSDPIYAEAYVTGAPD